MQRIGHMPYQNLSNSSYKPKCKGSKTDTLFLFMCARKNIILTCHVTARLILLVVSKNYMAHLTIPCIYGYIFKYEGIYFAL